MQPSNEPAPILRVTIGAPVYTADDQKLGKVKATSGTHFQVETGLFQKDYWLSGEVVAEAVPDHSVILSVDKTELDTHKLNDEPMAA
jgi:hypothetical protein